MKLAVIVMLAMLVGDANAAYFRLLHPLDEVKSGAFIRIGVPEDRISYGFQTTLIKHYASDGAVLVPGVSYSLFDIGVSKPDNAHPANLVLGPSLDISEPIKAVLLRGLDYVYPNSFQAVRALLWPAVEGKACVSTSVGPGLAVDPGDFKHYKTAKGALVLHAGLSAKF